MDRPDVSVLRDWRTVLRDLCTRHWASVSAFRAETGGPWFVLERGEDEGARGPNDIRHSSSTASCLESLLDVGPLGEPPDPDDRRELLDRFAERALARGDAGWQSDGGGATYCRVRVLPVILEQARQDVIDAHAERIREHLAFIWRDVAVEPGYQGVSEHDREGSEGQSSGEAGAKAPRYPPNSFLTFWALRVLQACRGRQVVAPDQLRDKEQIALLWTRETLALQTALAGIGSDDADPQQLAWSISTIARFDNEEELRQPASLDLIRAGLAAFLSQRRTNGSWPRGEPLFHYPESGNAYCYTFETLSELLRVALHADRTQSLTKFLLPHSEALLLAGRNAETNKEELTAGAIGWCSRHHPHRTYPESWATAVTFSFLESLRWMVGNWSAEEARTKLTVRTPRWPVPRIAEAMLKERGDTWPVDGWSVGDRLGALFLNPILSTAGSAHADPDSSLVHEKHARSAILFGPPGTSKTTLVEALAGAIGWDFLEIHASHFLTQGMNNVAAEADQIFTLVMELDRCVVLFDEIDELLRDRSEESDPFGRFLTTSMLPKLARLWEQRRVLFFVNTNWIDRADPAIRRSQRFDATLFVPAPSLAHKIRSIQDSLDADALGKVTLESVNRKLSGDDQDDRELGWLALLRHDQLTELTALLARGDGPANFERLKDALSRIGDHLRASDWHVGGKGDPAEDEWVPFQRFKELGLTQTVDFGRRLVARLDRNVDDVPPEYEKVADVDGKSFLQLPIQLDAAPQELDSESWHAHEDGLMRFVVDS